MPSSIFGKHCTITDYSFMPANSTLHFARKAKDDSPKMAIYYNVHDMNLNNCHIKSSVYDYYNVSGGISTKKFPRPVDLIWRLAMEEMETKKYTTQENSDLLFSAVLLGICWYFIPNNAIVRYSGVLSFLYYLIKYRGDNARATNAVAIQIVRPMLG